MSAENALRLVKSLSKSEKRHFKIHSKKQDGDLIYLDLFDLIDSEDIHEISTLKALFKKKYPKANLDNTSRYLTDLILDCLIQSKIKEDHTFQLIYGLLRVSILKDRNLAETSYKELKKLKVLASDNQELLIQYHISRYERDHLAQFNFMDIPEKQLVDMQMESRSILRDIRNTNEHYALHELLKYRLIHSGRMQSEQDAKQLNDLLLSEISIVNSRVKANLEAQKLHLLFQSAFFTDIGDYKSSLKIFYELNRLFEKNAQLLHNPPQGYYLSLDGILDNLRVMELYPEMDYYIRKLEQLDNHSYPEYYRFIIRKSILIYRIVMYLGLNNLAMAIQCIENSDPNLQSSYRLVDEEKHNELQFYMAFVQYKKGNHKKAQRQINNIIMEQKSITLAFITRAARLLSIIMLYEAKELNFLEYEIRSYKRAFKGDQKPLQMEQLIFKVIKQDPGRNTIKKNEQLWKMIEPSLSTIRHNKYELQLLKYFDFTKWIQSIFGKID